MLQTSVTNVGAPLTIIGKDLDAGGTFNADLNPNAGKQRAGRLMSYDPATKQLTPWDGVADAAGATIFGVLADDVDVTADNTKVTAAVMVYRDGDFLRQEIESANNAAIPAGGPLDLRLADLGIMLGLSYEGYQGLDPVPAGAEPMGLESAEDLATQGFTKVTSPQPNPAKTVGPTTEPPAKPAHTPAHPAHHHKP